MNTQGKLSSNNNKNWLPLAGIILLVSGISFGSWYLFNSQKQNSAGMNQPPPPTTVKLMTIQPETIKETTEVLGRLDASERVSLKSEAEGRLMDILVSEGEIVNQGGILFRLDSATLDAELQQAKANLASRQAQLAELQAGSRVEEIASAKARLRQAEISLANAVKGSSFEEIASAKAQLDSAIAEANLANQKVNRFRLLKEEGAISADQFDDIVTSAKTSNASVEQARRRLNQLQEGNIFDTKQLQSEVDEAKQDLLLLENGARKEEIDQAQANVNEAKGNLQRIETLRAKMAIKAPIEGIIGNIPVKIGDYIDNDTILTTITQNNLLELNFSIPLENLTDLKLGLPVQLLDGKKQVIATGEISFISPNVTSDSQLVTAQAIFSNVDSNLLNQQFIPARIVWDTSKGILAPTSAIFRIGSQAFVFVAKNNPEGEGLIAEQRTVRLGAIQGNSYEILDGVNPGDQIVTAGILQLRDGSRITVNNK